MSGGLAVFVRNSLESKIIENKSIDGLHYVRLEIKLCGNLFNFVGVYRPPSFDYNTFQDILESWLTFATPSKPFIVVGDINVPINMQNNNVVTKYKNLLESYGYVCTNTIPTRPISNNILDHCICPIDLASQLQNYTIFNEISDHIPVISSLALSNGRKHQELRTSVVDHVKLQNEFSLYLNNFQITDDVDAVLKALIAKYNSLVSECTRSFSKTINVKGDHCPWMTFNLWRLIQIKNNYLERHKRNPGDLHVIEMLAHVSKKVKTTKIQCKKQYYENILKSSSHSNVWKNLNRIFGRTKTEERIKLRIDGHVLDSGHDVAEVFNSFFSTIGNNLANKLPNSNFDFLNPVKQVSNSIFLRPTSANEVRILINELDSNKSRGHDNIPADLLKANMAPFSEIITKLFNKIITTGSYPDVLKIAKITPVFKSGDTLDPSNYRPISTLSALNKILEKLLTSRLVNFLCANNVMYKYQYGFREGCGTTTAIIELFDELAREIDRKKIVGGLFIDLKKAFDTLNHEILLKKLEKYGIRGVANDLIRSYLSNRKQYVTINGARSSLRTTDIGVPQGSNIGPLLFLLYINDLGNLRLHGIPRLFADDTALFYPQYSIHSVVRNIESDLECLIKYFNGNRLSMNLTKTKYMIFRSLRKLIPHHPDPCINNVHVEKVSSFKYLGLHLDSFLSWDTHIKQVSKKVSTLCGLMKRVRSFVHKEALLKFYYACIHSILQYLIIVWGHAAKSKIKKIQVLQNRCIKVIFNLPPLFPTNTLYTNLGHKIIPILGLRDSQTIMFVHNILNNRNFHHNIAFPNRANLRTTRHAHELLRNRANTNLGLVCISNYGPLKFNSLPISIKGITSTSLFKSKLKQHLLRNVTEYIV